MSAASHLAASPARWFESVRVRQALLLAAAIAGLVWFFRPARPDFLAYFDHTVDAEWRPNYLAVDAIAHLQGGRRYQFDPDFGDVDYDQSFLLPLLVRLRDEAGIHWEGLAYPDEPERLYAVIGLLPAGGAARDRVREILKDEDEAFAGAIFDQWGHRWLGLDYYAPEDIDPQMERFLKENFSRD